jgi:hypothetical protein
MLVSVLIRRLREDRDYEDFRRAWYPQRGFGVPTRVLSGVRLEDPREIVTVGFMDVAASRAGELVGTPEARAERARRHAAIDAVIESFPVQAVYELVDDEDFSDLPRASAGAPGTGILGPH